ncbi:leucine-rich repeat receptor-like protein kinase PXC1 [Nymphaea colorata]|nr:leucine-rich repeat receptor-like protein kinase PXC1 [Nymphaea colorata]
MIRSSMLPHHGTSLISSISDEKEAKPFSGRTLMAPPPPLSLVLLFLLLLAIVSSANNDTDSLLDFMRQTDAHGSLRLNWTGGNACSGGWEGVGCRGGRVTTLSLPSLDLRGPVDSLRSLDQLRHLDLHNNRLNGSLAPLLACANLKLVYLSSNEFSGEIPGDVSLLTRLLRIDLANNNLRGGIPSGLLNLTRLITLRLQNNVLGGPIPDLSTTLVHLKELNLSNNEFYGELPEALEIRFGLASFSGNAGLCGRAPPFPHCSFSNTAPSPTTSQQSVVPSNPSSVPGSGAKPKSRGGLSTGTIVGIVVGDAVVLLLLVVLLLAYYCGRYHSKRENRKIKAEKGLRSVESFNGEGYDRSPSEVAESERSKLVFFERRKRFELEDLLRASAEMLGKGSLGTVYKAILEDGSVVAVKRLKEAQPSGRKEFEQYMDMIGRMRHPNIVRLKAYYYAKEEKLLIYDYLPNGTLYSLLHGNRGPGRTPLDWTTRISLALGAARGLGRIHEEYGAAGIPHGNVKSSNILLDKNGIACVSDFGLALLLNPVQATARLGGYKAPEQSESKRLSQKSDVYAFGVLLLELLTGRAPAQKTPPPQQEGGGMAVVDLPKWVQSIVREEWTAEVFDAELLRYKNIEEELVAMLQIALACVVSQPEARPTMAEVVKMIEDIRVEQSPLGEEWDDSRNSISPSVADEGLTSC